MRTRAIGIGFACADLLDILGMGIAYDAMGEMKKESFTEKISATASDGKIAQRFAESEFEKTHRPRPRNHERLRPTIEATA